MELKNRGVIMKKIKAVILGYGDRSSRYANYALKKPEELEIIGCIDVLPYKLVDAKNTYNIPENMLFSSLEDFIKAGVKCDVVINGTMDELHYETSVQLLSAGYNILLEKPICPKEEELLHLKKLAEENNCKVVVCHVLRYTPFYTQIKQIIQSGELGDILAVYTSENVGYYHQAHSFVRGPWGNKEKSSPMILAKCCHDMDLLSWLIDKKCEKVASFGSLSYFKQENAPKNCANYCSDCSVDCMYRAQDLYKKYRWMAGYFSQEKDFRKIKKALLHTQYDRCVFRHDNDVVDHQVCIFTFEGGITASHTMDAFSDKIYRDIKIHGTKAELFGIMEQNLLEIRPFGKKVKRITINKDKTAGGHGGGDAGIMNELYNAYNGLPTERITHIDSSMQSHKMAFAAEKARITESVIELK